MSRGCTKWTCNDINSISNIFHGLIDFGKGSEGTLIYGTDLAESGIQWKTYSIFNIMRHFWAPETFSKLYLDSYQHRDGLYEYK